MSSSDKVTEYIDSYTDWRGNLLGQLRAIINENAAHLTEDFKWNVPVWTGNGMVCAISAFKGVYLPDPNKLFNSGLESKEHRSINFSEGAGLDKAAVQNLVQAAIAHNKA